LLYEYGDINELAEKILLVLKDDELRQKLSEGAVCWAKSFSWDDSADLMLNKINDVINNFQK